MKNQVIVGSCKALTIFSMPSKIKDSPSEKQNAPQIMKLLVADSAIDAIGEEIFFDMLKSKENSDTVRNIDVSLNTLSVPENDPLPVETPSDDVFVISESENASPLGRTLYRSGWEYGQLVKEFRDSW
jgi:hypothetical protein